MPKEKKQETTEQICVKCAEYLDGWKHALADYDNLKKDLFKEREQIRKMAKEDVAHELISVLDNLDQAVKFLPGGLEPNLGRWVAGVAHVRNQLESVLLGLGLETNGTVGELFDPNIHEAVGHRFEEGKQDQEILEVQHRGWNMGEKVIRPAKVIINNPT